MNGKAFTVIVPEYRKLQRHWLTNDFTEKGVLCRTGMWHILRANTFDILHFIPCQVSPGIFLLQYRQMLIDFRDHLRSSLTDLIQKGL